MQDDIKKMLELLDEESVKKILEEYGLEIDSLFDDFTKIIENYREKIHLKYFSFLDKYKNDKVFFEKLNVSENMEFLLLTKFFVSDAFYRKILDQYYLDEDKLLNDGFAFEVNDLEYFFSKGISLKTIVEKYYLLDDVQIKLYNDYPEFRESILNRKFDVAPYLIAAEITKGQYKWLDKYFGTYTYMKNEKLKKILTELSKFDNFDFNAFFDLIVTNYFVGEEISILNDDAVVKRLIEIGGSKALIFASNPSDELVKMANFSYSDYSLYGGAYQNSSALLLQFLKEGKMDALMYAKSGAINEEVIKIIDNSGIPLERLNSYSNLVDSPEFIYYLAGKGDYSLIKYLPDTLINLKSFEYVYSLIKEGKVNLDEYYSLGHPVTEARTALLRGILYDKWTFFDDGKLDISLPVAKRLIDLGFKAVDFQKHFSKSEKNDILIEAFIENGEFLPLLLVYSDKLADKYYDKVNYELYLNAKEVFGDFSLSLAWIYKFVKEGHYDVLDEKNKNSIIITSDTLTKMGLDNLTYEEYLKLPENIKNIPVLMEKYLDRNSSYLKEIISKNKDINLIEKAILGGMSYDELCSLIDGSFDMNVKTIMYMLNHGDSRGIKHLSNVMYSEKIDELVDSYYSFLNGGLPNEELADYSKFVTLLIDKYIDDANYTIFTRFKKIENTNAMKLLSSSYSFEDFKKYPVFNGNVISKFATKENEEELVNTLINVIDTEYAMYFIDATKLFFVMYKNGYSAENIKKLQKKIHIDFNILIKMLPKEDYNMFNIIDIDSVLDNKIFLDKIFNSLSLEKIEELAKSYRVSSDVKLYIIRKMVMKGHYNFVSYYSNKIEEDVLKRALLGGYFPEEQILENRYFNLYLRKINFSKEELEYLKIRLGNNPRYVIFFPEILNDNEILCKYIEDTPDVFKLLDIEKRKNLDLLKALAKKNPELCAFSLFNDIETNSIVELIEVNPELLKYLDKRFITKEVMEGVLDFYPNIIDFSSNYLSDEFINNALLKGYEFSFISNPNIIRVGLLNNRIIDKEILINLGMEKLLYLADRLIINEDSPFNNLFKELIDDIYQRDIISFLYESYNIKKSSFNTNKNVLNIIDAYGIDFDRFNSYKFSTKDEFAIFYQIDCLLKTEEGLTEIEKILDTINSLKREEIFCWLLNRFDENVVTDTMRKELAKRYFADDPFYYINYVDVNDEEIQQFVKDNIDKYPGLYIYFPDILEDRNIVLKVIANIDSDHMPRVYGLLNKDFQNDLEILEIALASNEIVFMYVDCTSDKIIEFAKANLLKYPIVFTYIPNLVTDKETALKLVNYNMGCVYEYLPDNLKSDFDICNKLLDVNVNLIFDFSVENINFYKLAVKALGINGNLLDMIVQKIELDEELIIAALKTNPAALFMAPDEYFTAEMYSQVTDLTKIAFENMTLPKVLKLIHFDSFDVTNFKDCQYVVSYILANIKDEDVLDKNDVRLKEIFANVTNFENENLECVDFKQIVMFLPKVGIDFFKEDIQEVLANASIILKATGKLNTLEKNPIFSYDVVKYIYPLFGVDFVKDLIKYNTPAAAVLCDEIKGNNQSLVVGYYNLINEYNIFENDDKKVHYVFRNFKEVKELIFDILDKHEKLSKTDMENLKKIIVGQNIYQIKTLDELKKFDSVTQEFWQQKLQAQNVLELKNALATLFGYVHYNDLEKEFNNFQLNNYVNLKTIRTDIIEKYGSEKASEIFKKCFYNKKDVSIITLMERIIESHNVTELRELMATFINKNGNVIDFANDVREIIAKTRMLYNYQFNAHLTQIADIKSKRLEKDAVDNPYGVTIIEMDSEKFNFLAHRIYSYDKSMQGFKNKLEQDPSLWTKLEGASTLSTSSISDKGFWFLNNTNECGVIYLFNNLPEKFLLFMDGRDLFVEHGGYKIEPTANKNAFTTIDGLNQCSCYKNGQYNEVAGFREGMLPCAFACVGAKPNEETIRAAKYFSEFLGVDIPIIKFNVKAYDDRKKARADKALAEFKAKPTKEAMEDIFFDGIKVCHDISTIENKITDCTEILNEKYRNKEISFEELYKSLIEMEAMVNLIIVDLPTAKKSLKKIEIFRKSLLTLNTFAKEEIIKLEEAALGESGIMYKYQEGEKNYLLKPAVDKQKLASQPFRAEIQAAASKLQEFLSPETAVKVESFGGNIKLSKQELIDFSNENAHILEKWVQNGGELEQHYTDALLREYVVDFLLCNFDCFVGNFIVDANNNVRGIDKEQSFRFISDPNSLNPDFSYTPNGTARIPIYQILFDRYKKGEVSLDLSVILDTIEKVNLLTDEEYKNIFKDYAYKLAKQHGEDLLDAILKRRDIAIVKIKEYVEQLQEMKKSEGVTL